jgi:hypothetical protein
MANVKISELNPLLTVQDADVLPIVDNGVTKKVTAAILQSYTQGNSVLLTGAQTVAGVKTFTSQLASSVATGTAPFSVASTTKVTNLNADLLDGLSSADFQATLSGSGIVKSTSGTISYLTDNSTNWNTAYNDKINSAAVTGSGTNTLTLTQQDAGTITATWVNGTLIREIRNTTGATLTKGTIVYISGANGNKPTVSKAIATGDSTSAQTFGFVQADIANNANGYVVVVGDLTGVDTSAFNEGDQLYLSSTTAGAFTSTKQYAPAHLVYVGIVTRSHPTLGQIEVNIQNGYEMDELHNVSAQNPSNGDILQYVTSTGLWTKVAGSTTNISEGTNLYYTAARFNSAFAGKTTTDLTEGTNLYFTNARARGAISLTTSGTSGAATYNSSTGVLNIPNYADTDTGITSLNGLTALSQTFAVGTSGTDFAISSDTSTHTFNLPTASATNRGALSSADWTTFNNKQNALTNPITGTGTTNYLPKFTGTSALGNSIVSDDGTLLSINGNLNFSGNNYFKILFGSELLLNNFKATSSDGENIFLGRVAGNETMAISTISSEASFNTGIGVLSLNKLTSGWSNVGIGYQSLTDNTSGKYNTATGVHSLGRTTTGDRNVAFGHYAGYENITGQQNVYIGASTGRANTSGSYNTLGGVESGYLGNGGNYNTAWGHSSLKYASGSYNSSFGVSSLGSLTTGQENATFGLESFRNATTGSKNTAIGANSGQNNNGDRNIFIGYESGYYETGSNKLFIDNQNRSSESIARNSALIYGVFNSSVSSQRLNINGELQINNGTANQNTKIFGNKVGMSRTSDAAEVVYFSKNTDLGAEGTANINGYDGIQFRTQGAESVKMTIKANGVINIASIPTSPAGLSTGDIWSNLGILTIV